MKKRNFLVLSSSSISIMTLAASVVSCGNELTEKEVVEQTKVELDNSKDELFKLDITNVTKRLRITSAPKDWKVNVTNIEVDKDIKISLKATKGNTTYNFAKTFSYLLEYDKYLELALKDIDGLTIKSEDNSKHFATEFDDKTLVETKSKDSRYIYEVDKTESNLESGSLKVIVVLKDKIKNNEIAKIEKDFSNFRTKVDELLTYKLLDKENNNAPIEPANYKDHYVDKFGYGQVKIDSTNSNYFYKVEKITPKKYTGELDIIFRLYNKDEYHKLAEFKVSLTGFKQMLEPDDQDFTVSIKNLTESQYKDKNAGDIKEEEIQITGKSSKYKYELRSLVADDAKGILTINIKQMMPDGKEIINQVVTLKGFKVITEADKNDPKVIIEGLDESQYSTVTPEDAIKNVVRINSKSGKYQYQIEKMEADNANGKIKFSLKWAVKNGSWSTETFEFELTGFKTA